jgi:hypothetical protein
MAKFVIAYRAPRDYVPGRAGDMAAWASRSLADPGFGVEVGVAGEAQ